MILFISACKFIYFELLKSLIDNWIHKCMSNVQIAILGANFIDSYVAGEL